MVESAEVKPSFIERVAATSPTIGPTKALFSLLALPFYLLGFVIGVLWVVGAHAVGAVKLGVAEARSRMNHPARPMGDGA